MRVEVDISPPAEPLFPALPFTRARRTSEALVRLETAPLEQAASLQELSRAAAVAQRRLESMGIFKEGSVVRLSMAANLLPIYCPICCQLTNSRCAAPCCLASAST